MTTLTITVDDLIRFGPCYEGEQLEELLALFRSRSEWSAVDISALTQYPAQDRLWLMLRPELIPEQMLHELGCQFAEHALTRERENHREPDQILWDAISDKRRWLAGEISDNELASSRNLAMHAAICASPLLWDSAMSAAWATSTIARDAARNAVVYAASAALDTTMHSDGAHERYLRLEWQLAATIATIKGVE